MFPDIELLLTSYLAARTEKRTVTELPANLNDVLPVIRVTRVSGADEDFHLDHPVVDVDVFAADRASAWALSEQIRHMLRWDLPTTDCVQDAGVVTSVRTVNAPRWLPDSNINLRRYNASYQVTAHA